MKNLKVFKFIMAFCLVGCMKIGVKRNDVIGEWRKSQNTCLIFNEDGTFTGSGLPCKLFLNESCENIVFDGIGVWEIDENKYSDLVSIVFKKTSNKSIYGGYATHIIIGREKNNLTMYKWLDEEGGDRYEFLKINGK